MKLYNTLTREKEEFKPLKENSVKIYVCGPTVYNYIHIGNARPLVVFDTLRRYFEYKGYKVKYIVNFTDIDDKLITKAKLENTTVKELSEKYIKEYLIDSKNLNVKEESTIHPKATDHIEDMIDFIKGLIEKGFAYEKCGDVYFDVRKYKEYGKLSKKNLDELLSGARIRINEVKLNPADFALWKSSKEGEPFWNSPWGNGRPGWHIECSVMARKHLGETIDIHAGGEDLQFPHHENEIAQSESLNGKKFANYWLHNGMINIDNEKMSKSKGNFFTIRDIESEFNLEVVRFFLLSAHYRKPLNFTKESVEQAERGLERIYKGKEKLEEFLKVKSESKMKDKDIILEKMKKIVDDFENAMDDDLNTADGISHIFELVKLINTEIDENSSENLINTMLKKLKELGEIIGIFYIKKDNLEQEIEELINQRQESRKNKDFKLADKIRDDLLSRGILLEDTPIGVKWRKK